MLARKILLSFTVLVGCIAVIEISFRLFSIATPPSTVSLNRGKFSVPGTYTNIQSEFRSTVHVNSHGFVDKEWHIDHSKNNILLLGDSFVQAAQVDLEKGIGRRLEEYLTTRIPNTVVYSIGIPGAGTTTEYEILKEYIDIIKPSTIILGFLPANDVLNNHPNIESKQDKPFYDLVKFRKDGTLSLTQTTTDVNSPPSLWLHSRFLTWIARSMEHTKIAQNKIEKGNGIPIDLYVYAENPNSDWKESWQLTQTIVEHMQNFSNQKESALYISIFPVELQISPKKRQEVEKQWAIPSTWKIQESLSAKTAQMIENAGISTTHICNLESIFTKHNQDFPNIPLYYPNDGHWTPTGHDLAAKTIADCFWPIPASAE